MSLDEKFIPIRDAFYKIVESCIKTVAKVFGYPDNPGMPAGLELYDSNSKFIASLPRHKTLWPPLQRPQTLFEMIVGPAPKVEPVPRYFYESKDEGFYNFYIDNYKNIYFLPNWLSEFIQVRFNICLDLTVLETIREVFFIGLMVYSQVVILRIALSWFIAINPYSFPWCYIVAVVDWTEDVLQGVVPGIVGVNVTGTVFLGILGVLADSLNHLVLTMPFLPSEGEAISLSFDRKTKEVIVFHYLPLLWYRYPIPNDIREFWYKERPDILNYMQKAYKDLNIQFLPDNLIKEFNQKTLTTDLSSIHLNQLTSTDLLSEMNFFSKSNLELPDLNIGYEFLENSVRIYIEKLF